jgi:hypothetical protein
MLAVMNYDPVGARFNPALQLSAINTQGLVDEERLALKRFYGKGRFQTCPWKRAYDNRKQHKMRGDERK